MTFDILLKNYPNLSISDKAKDHISSSQWQIKRLYKITSVINEIDKSEHIIDILQGPDEDEKIIKYMIPIESRKDRLDYQRRIVNYILEIIPDETFIDFMVKVYLEDT